MMFALLALLASAADPYSFEALRAPLDLGDPAPPLVVETWFQGTPLTAFEPGRIYVIDFWATWCKPCVDEIPGLEAVQAAHPDRVTVVMLNIWERDHDKIRAWLRKHPVALAVGHGEPENRPESPARAWFSASYNNGIPTSFIVGPEGTLMSITHASRVEALVSSMLKGEWSAEASQAERVENLIWHKYREPLWTSLDEVETHAERLPLYDAFIREHPHLEPYVASDRADALIVTNPDEAIVYAGRWVEEGWHDNADQLNNVAWTFALPGNKWPGPGVPGSEALARRAATRAVELTERREPNYLDTLALTLWRDGAHAEAIAVQAEAVEAAEKGALRKEFAGRWRWYRRHAP